jgi:REP element-mobilizing transposase RayT
LIDASWRGRLHKYLGGIIRNLDGNAEAIGGVADHIHILANLQTTHRLSDFMRELKASGSAWVHKEIGLRGFAWQNGYSAFTASATAIEDIRKYIEKQEEHHCKQTFKEELIDFLKRARIEYDPKFLL